MRVSQLIIAAILGSIITLGAYSMLGFDTSTTSSDTPSQNSQVAQAPEPTPVTLTKMPVKTPTGKAIPVDFTAAAAKSMPAVVHIKSSAGRTTAQRRPQSRSNDPYDQFLREFFGDDFFSDPRNGRGQGGAPSSTGSGVIVTNDGFIVTNNHVIDEATEIEVTLYDKRTFPAKVIGTDPTTDLALIKIEGNDYPKLDLANSDNARVGEWVLAVGNPFNLASTVTAGIVSAKARSIDILKNKNAIESFIQTDAAVNPGNSGGALVNVAGELLGINTAIATPTGTYAGYSFAVPANIVSKVVEDLKEYGAVQRGYLGITIQSLDGNVAKSQGIGISQGVLIDSVIVNGAAYEAGLQSGDVIVEADGAPIVDNPSFLGQVARHRPGENIEVKVNREGQLRTYQVKLRNKLGTTNVLANRNKPSTATYEMPKLGVVLEDADPRVLRNQGIRGGVAVKDIKKGGIIDEATTMEEGFVITKVKDKTINSIEDLEEIIMRSQGGVMVEGFYPGDPNTYYYAFGA